LWRSPNFYDQAAGVPPRRLICITPTLNSPDQVHPDGTEVRKSVPLRVAGVIAESGGEADYTFYLPLSDVTAYNEWMTGRRINRSKDGYPVAIVKVEDPQKVLEVAETITAMGYMVYTPMQYLQPINSFYTVLQVIFGELGAIAAGSGNQHRQR
jgi:putative ABC transport system permease protein